MNQLVTEFWKSVHICQSHYQTSRGILFWDTVYKVTHWSKTQNVSASHKEGTLNWWWTMNQETRVCKKGRVCTPYRGLCPVRDYSALVLPWQDEISGAATADTHR